YVYMRQHVGYLMPEVHLEMRSLNYQADSQGRLSAELRKTDDVMRYLNEFRQGGSLRLSASALKTYKQCPMKFYLEYARRMRGSDEMVDYIQASEFGTLVHSVIQKLFEGYRNQVITASTFDHWLNPGNHEVDDIARRLVMEQRYPRVADMSTVDPAAEALLAVDLVARIARANLKGERDLYCAEGQSFVFLDNEYKVNGVWDISDSLSVNFYMSIDRFDKLESGLYRFVDFKTGADDTVASDVAGLLNRNSTDKDGIFQLFTYAEAYKSMVDAEAHIVPVLHPMRQLSAGYGLGLLKVAGKEVTDYDSLRETFRPLLVDLVSEIFDENVPIRQCERIASCNYCNFQSLCGRIPRDD
ncbi:MAG: PD-(D/E)XK nuclease family protein, partial [Muribaculaceae bacterium]|nr:PD-(D/E)XK nuclease family protein [Muribaculaceae bacterium]